MGCYQTKGHCDKSINVFRVTNINENGSVKRNGHLRLSNSDLVYFEDNKEIVWPLYSLKRYGYDDEKLVIELGRRCPSGCGVYSFKTGKAEQIYTMLQNKVLQQVAQKSTIDNSNNNQGPQVAPRFKDNHYLAVQTNSNDLSYANLLLTADESENVDPYITINFNKDPNRIDDDKISSNVEKTTYAEIDFRRMEGLAKTANDRAQAIQRRLVFNL